MSTTGYRIYNPQSLGAAVRHFREEAGLTQAELAAAVGVHRSYLSDLEGGKVTEQVERLVRLFEHLGTRLTVDRAEW